MSLPTPTAASAADPATQALAAQKRALRTSLRQLRSDITPTQRKQQARRAATRLLRWRGLRRARRIGIYLSVRSELATGGLIEALLRSRRELWVPVTGRGGVMRFAPLRRGAPLRRSALGLPQPVRQRPLRPARRLDLILLPLLGFDATGHRLGNGGGYYDRALAGGRAGRRPLLLGYAYAMQEVTQVPAEPWDVRLDAVATERGLRRFR